MNIIIPMAGRGSRLRPHTHTTPKPMIPIAGKPIVERILQNIYQNMPQDISNVCFVIHPSFGKGIEAQLESMVYALDTTTKTHVLYQEQAKGTADAILQAKHVLDGEICIAFADTLCTFPSFKPQGDGAIFVKEIDDPSAFGVVKVDRNNCIQDYVEKPQDKSVGNLAMIGLYYFKNGAQLKKELIYIIDNNMLHQGEYQLPDALKRLSKNGLDIHPFEVSEWLDCGNAPVTIASNTQYLHNIQHEEQLVHTDITTTHSVIIPPCYIGKHTTIESSVIGPYVSIGEGSTIKNSVITHSLIQKQAHITNSVMRDSMLGNNVHITPEAKRVSLGDDSNIDS